MTDTHGRDQDPVAVLGAGIMGSAMARNLAACRAAHHGVGPVTGGDRAAVRGRRAGGGVAARGGPRRAPS